MNGYFKLTAALAAFALLVVLGLSTQSTVHAQGAPSESYICSNSQSGCTLHDRGTDGTTEPLADSTADNVFNVSVVAGGTAIIHNLDLPRVTQKIAVSTAADADMVDGPDANPKTVTLQTAAIIEAVHKSSGLMDARCSDTDGDNILEAGECSATGSTNNYQVKAFNGNRIQVSHTPVSGGTFASIKTVTVDNGRPALVSNSPDAGLIVKGNTNVTFSADITDSISGFAAKFTGTGGLMGNLSPDGLLTSEGAAADPPTNNDVTREGGVRLVVAGNVVALAEGDFTKIDGGWRVNKTLNSTALQAISTNVPWYFEVRDRANNVRRTSGSISRTVGAGSTGGTIIDTKLKGTLNPNTFLRSTVRVSKKDGSNTVTSNAQPLSTPFFAGDSGTLTITNTVADPLFNDAVKDVPSDSANDASTAIAGTGGYQCRFDARDTYTRAVSGTTTTATRTATNGADDEVEADQIAACNPAPKDSYEILGTNLITIDSVAPKLSSGSPVVTGKGYDSVKKTDKAQRNSIKVSFTDAGKSTGVGSDAPGSGIDPATVTAAAFTVGGHTVESVRVVGNTVYLTLADDLGSTEEPTVDIAGSRILDKAGNSVAAVRQKSVDQLGPKLSLSKSADLSNDKVTVTITTDEQLNAAPTVYVTMAEANGDAEIGDAGVSPVRQTGALSYSYAHEAPANGGEFSVYVTAEDVSEVESTVGDNDSAADPGSFTFELDKELNDNAPPQFDVASVDDVANKSGAADNVEQVDPLIVTVDFSKEGKEYDRDSYKKVTLTSAKLSIRLPDGTTETMTLNLTTDVSTPDNVKFTFPLLNPKIGAYTMTVQAMDQAGNTQVNGSADLKASWDVVKPKPVDIGLAPGWNLISLPFQPANPAINSVIGANHPADIVMTFDNATQVWMVSRRDADSGLFVGDIAVLSANTAYFVRTTNFQPLQLLRPPLATAAAAPPPPPAITVVEGWNLVPIVSNEASVPEGLAADEYFGTLGSGSNAGWLKALTFDTLSRTWMSVTPGDTVTLTAGDTNPCTGSELDADNVKEQTEPCQKDAYTDRDTGDAVAADETATPPVEADPVGADENDPDKFDDNDRVVMKAAVTVGKGYWLYATKAGVIIP